ncbi:hypothetical protein [Paraburkholderia fynbosensis]|uniref:hypothetical protein n=1 Tax=Paraburkholderia fynbosensis TaxID=1200993 RepID=UPI00158257E4|nr:hypothetical protein [Paraburkholderia fynbosensis]
MHYRASPKPEAMLDGLGSRFYVTETAIKTYSVAYSVQSPLDALLTLRKQYGLTPDNERSNAKARDLVAPVPGERKTQQLIEQVNKLETVDNLQQLRPFFTVWIDWRTRCVTASAPECRMACFTDPPVKQAIRVRCRVWPRRETHARAVAAQ